jgi:cysteine-rich repeat protein
LLCEEFSTHIIQEDSMRSFLKVGLLAGFSFVFIGCGEDIPPAVCGNNAVEDGEVCDDGNTVADDGCSAACDSDETCGNGVLDDDILFAEECDDGNVVAGDGCDAFCIIELDPAPACDAAVAAQANNTGDTLAGTAVLTASCTGDGNEEVFSFTPAAANITLLLLSATDQGVYVRATCEDAASEIECEDIGLINDICEDGQTPCTEATAAADCAGIGGALCVQEVTTVAVTAGTAISIVVDAFAVGEEGPFTLIIQ